jgi:trans-aconitate 2-methyltransferase
LEIEFGTLGTRFESILTSAFIMQNSLSPPMQEQRMMAAVDLLRHVPNSTPRRVAYLRHRPEPMVELLVRRFPNAEIIGIEYSQIAPDLAKTRRLHFDAHDSEVDLSRQESEFDLICVNGTLEMLPSLRQLLARLLSLIAIKGRLAVHIPNDAQEPNRALARMVAAEGPWAKQLVPIAKTRPFNETVEGLYDLFHASCASLEVWETTYILPVESVAAIIDWMRDTSLEPFLRPLDERSRRRFLERYSAELARAYPPQPDGKVLLRFPRIFLLARR